MSFQAYLDNIEAKTGKTPNELIALATERGYDDPATKAGHIVAWLKEDFGLGHGHAMALVQVLKNGAKISSKHVGSTGRHRDESDTLRDIQAVARDQHAVSLQVEIEAAAALLRAADIDARVDVHLPAPERRAEEVIAWAVREGTTNVLRHSDAAACSISAGRRGGAVFLEMTNDGARGPEAAGSGLAGLRARAEALAGSVVAGHIDDERFRLVVEIPERAP